jgi:hypothetical protein
MEASKLCPAPHIEAAELTGDTIVTIKGVRFAKVGEDKVDRGVIDFKEFDRGMVLNRTNLKRIIGHHGNDTEGWVGKKITIYPSETDYAGRTVPCIRVREKK